MSLHTDNRPGADPGSTFTLFDKPAVIMAIAVSTCALAMLSLPVRAQPTPVDYVEEIIVTSNRIPIPLRQIGTSVAVLDEFDIQSHGNLNMADLLRQMPAIGASSSGGIGKATAVRIRGEEGFRTLTLFDGMRLLDPGMPQIATSFGHLLTAGIGRIEVLRGPQGLAYGADAGGVITISSRDQAEGFRAAADAQTGRYGTRQLAANIGGRSGQADYFLAATEYSTDGFNTRDSDTTLRDDDGYDNRTLHARLGLDVNEQWRLTAVHRQTTGENEFDGCFAGRRVEDCTDTTELRASRLAVEFDGAGFSHSLSYHSTVTERENFVLGTPGFNAEGELRRWEYLGSATGLNGFDLVFGADREQAINNRIGRDNTGLFLEYLSDFSAAFFLTAGLRHDDNDDFGTNTSYRISGVYLSELATGSLKFKAALGTGFRAPSPAEIAYNARPGAFPPAAEVVLRQEQSAGWELGVEYFGNDWRLEAVYFDQQIENALFFDLVTFSGYLQDTGTSHSRGIELGADLPLGAFWRATGNYTWNRTERPDGNQRLQRPEHLLNLGLLYHSTDSRLTLAAYYRAQADSIDSGSRPLDDFGVLDLTGSYQLTDNLRIHARIENALDAEYQEILDYNTAGSAVYIGVNLGLGH